MKQITIYIAVASAVLLSACMTNPVTGQKQFSLVSEQQELAIGAQQYAPLRQSQGGDYQVDLALTAYVNQVGQRLAAVSDRQLPYEFKVLNNSVPNAWALPGGKIVINRGLLVELHNEAELAAVSSHEITHAAARHTAVNMSKGQLLQIAVMGASVASQGKSYGNSAQMGANIGAQLLTTQFSRDAEREADYYGMLYMSRAGYNPEGAVALQQTFVKLSESRSTNWLQGMFASHPPSQERVNSNRMRLQELPAGGDYGERNFLAKTAHLRAAKPAYDAYDKAQAALAKGETRRARSLIQKAIQLEPKEGHFHAFSGDIYQKNKQYSQAIKQYNEASYLNPNFFYYYVQRGKVEQQLKSYQKAEADYKRGIELLPTADAYYGLAGFARASNRNDEAKQYYTAVAKSQSPLGKAAYGDLVDLDLAANPAQYLSVQIGVLPDGNAALQVQNPTPRNVQGVIVRVQYTDAAGQVRQLNKSLPSVLAAGSGAIIKLGFGALSKEQLASLRGTVVRANISK